MCTGEWGLATLVPSGRSGIPRPQRICPHCASNVVGDERHMVFECEALQTTRENFAGLFGPAIVTMQQFMWQGDLVQVAHLCLNALRSLRPWVMTKDRGLLRM